MLLALIFISSLPVFAQFEDLTFGSDSTFEVLTWNLEWFPKNGQITIGYVSEIIEALDVDVIAVQEIDNQVYFEQMVENIDGWDGYWVESGYLALGYIYKNDLFDDVLVFEILTNSSREFPRPPLVLEVSLNNDTYIIINNHFKCCGDGYLDINDDWDEEKRRYDASVLLNQYILDNYPDDKVILLGDLNDLIDELPPNNVFQVFLDNPDNYNFVDMDIASGSNYHWSYPSWPSHLDHILITNELFDDFNDEVSVIETIRLDDYFEFGFDEYDENVSDHRPVGLKLPVEVISESNDPISITGEIRNYPNPIFGSTTITFLPASENSSLEIIDPNGRSIFNHNLIKNQSSLIWYTNNTASGSYYARLIINGKSGRSHRMVVIK